MDQLKEWIEPVLADLDCELYDIEWDTKMKPAVLRISIENKKGPTDLDTCAACSDAISKILDEKDYSDSEYMLEVCSPGAERELKTTEHLQKAVGKYIYVKLKDPKNGVDALRGTLESADENTIAVSYHVKGRPKKMEIARDNIAFISTAVKI